MMSLVRSLMIARIKAMVMTIVRVFRAIFDDWLTRAAGIVCLLIVAIVIFNMHSNISDNNPLLGTIIFAMVPVLFICGGVIFIMAILKFSKQGNNNDEAV